MDFLRSFCGGEFNRRNGTKQAKNFPGSFANKIDGLENLSVATPQKLKSLDGNLIGNNVTSIRTKASGINPS
jgi:formylmethanofuran dehydrogenase subunit E-like metal-binding protein